MINIIALPFNAVASNVLKLKHFVFSTIVVNIIAYGIETWVIDTSATDHIVCSMHLYYG